jgi:hypothetical protein
MKVRIPFDDGSCMSPWVTVKELAGEERWLGEFYPGCSMLFEMGEDDWWEPVPLEKMH